MADTDGRAVTFNPNYHPPTIGTSSTYTFLPATIEDRNGNVVSVADPGNGQFTFTDSTGRAVISSSGFGTAGATYNLAVSGLSPYQVTWINAPSNFSVGWTVVAGNACGGGINPENGSQSVVSAITLPNGQLYQFQYDHTYGLLSKVIYPNGAYSRYVWG